MPIEMSGTPPPNYNPNDSLLSGGEGAKILPVQGGGSMIPGNYNANVSLLSGGEDAKIQAVQGGGGPEEYQAKVNKYKREMAEYESLRKKGLPSGPPPQSIPSAAQMKATSEFQASMMDRLKTQSEKLKKFQGNIDTLQGSQEQKNEENNENNENNNISNEETIDSSNEENNDFSNEAFSTVAEENNEENNDTNNEENNEENNDTNKNNSNDVVEGEVKVKEIPCAEPDSKELEDLDESFQEDLEAKETKVTETIRLQAQEFILRKPKAKQIGKEEKDEVMTDWKEGVFTDSEADFLNLLGLSPKLLYSSFICLDRDWKEELANFLYYLTVMSCYPARNVMSKGDCQHVREFLMIVESNLKAQKLRRLAERPIPVVGAIKLSELEEEENEKNENTNKNNHHNVLDRLKGLNVDESKEVKSFTRKVKNFLSKLKFPSLFKKMKQEQEEGEFPEEVEEGENVNDDGSVVPVVSGAPAQKTREEIEREYAEKLRELEIKKTLEGLPKEYQTETYRQYINRELRKEGFKEGNFNS